MLIVVLMLTWVSCLGDIECSNSIKYGLGAQTQLAIRLYIYNRYIEDIWDCCPCFEEVDLEC